MRSPVPAATRSVAPLAITAGLVLLALAAAALLLLQAPAVPPAILDGLTSPASFGARTT
jgi:hypothetical protein